MQSQSLNFVLIIILSPFILLSCKDAPIYGKVLQVDNRVEHTVYLVKPNYLSELSANFLGDVVAEAKIDKEGYFYFHDIPQDTAATLYELLIHQKGEKYKNRKINDVVEASNYFPIIYQPGEKIRVKANALNLQQSLKIVNASPANKALMNLRDLKFAAYKAKEKRDKTLDKSAETFILDVEKSDIAYRKSILAFADTCHQALPVLQCVRWASPEGDYERIAEYLPKICNAWREKEPTHPWMQELCAQSRLSKLPLLVDDQVPAVRLPLADGQEKQLKNLLGKRLTILDFWASWCAPCRHENRKILAPLYESYHAHGLRIIGYALESDKEHWLEAAAKDGADKWYQASHLQGDNAPVMDAFKITTIPANYIIDADGKILAKNIHGENLVKFVEEHLNKNK